MQFTYTKHAEDRILERGATKREVEATVKTGSRGAARGKNIRFEQVFAFGKKRQEITYKYKRISVFAELLSNNLQHWKIITVIVQYY